MHTTSYIKLLSAEHIFIRKLNLVDITKRLKGLRQADGDDLDALYIH
jgi:hypothetical protein